MWQPGWVGSLGENGYMYVCMADSPCCLPVTITTLLINYTLKQKQKKKVKKNKRILVVSGKKIWSFPSYSNLKIHDSLILHRCKTCVLIATVYLELSTKYLDQRGDQ